MFFSEHIHYIMCSNSKKTYGVVTLLRIEGVTLARKSLVTLCGFSNFTPFTHFERFFGWFIKYKWT